MVGTFLAELVLQLLHTLVSILLYHLLVVLDLLLTEVQLLVDILKLLAQHILGAGFVYRRQFVLLTEFGRLLLQHRTEPLVELLKLCPQ